MWRWNPSRSRLGADNAAGLVAGRDLVLDGSDSFDSRLAVNAACVAARVPLLAGAIGRWEGQLSLYAPHLGAPCFACVFPERPARDLVPACAEAGVLGALAGVIGTMMAVEAVKHLAGVGRGLAGRLVLHDALEGETRSLSVRRRPGCPVCGGA
ncbi:MAG: hypothetical protein KatS3mg118_0482 [Paracoccaceae bacterium]|nr:MAG: hypothetical protein KatS3mg118_0482 [Paracoccaceae bacterium]